MAIDPPMSSSEYALFCAERQRAHTEKRENKIEKIMEKIKRCKYPLEDIIASRLGIALESTTKGEIIDREVVYKEMKMFLRTSCSLDELEEIYRGVEKI